MSSLRICTTPPVKVYHHHAFCLGIILTEPEGFKWILNNYIQVCYYNNMPYYAFDYYMDYPTCQPVFEREHINDDMFVMSKIKVMKYIINALNTGRYVTACVDEFYIPERSAYMYSHFDHNILIYGYDNVTKKFNTCGYNDQGKYKQLEISYSDIKKSSPHDIDLLKIRKGFEYQVNIEDVIRQIRQYLNLENTAQVGAYPKEGLYVGLNACIELQDNFYKDSQELKQLDMRPVCLLFEHKKLMYERIKYIGKTYSIDVEKVLQQYDTIVKQSEILKQMVLKYEIRRSIEVGIAIDKKFSRIFAEEKECLEEFLNLCYNLVNG